MTMTWGEFKKFLESEGVTDGMKIGYIDVSYPYAIFLNVELPDEDHDLRVWS